ncbi:MULTISPECIES: hypothetical protein [Nostocales]|uniref:Uncharacterized protein n=3 Tax=Nostocales TaxID=1161 RepID=A0A0C1QZY3_9CYAN|nr:hypothetical protein [Tolypothrix bouteillei]KAF3885147.1 hypothetical protein DA73_0400006470 [Tolypothrix bouteillei VB521301]
MNESNPLDLLNQLLQKDASDVLAWLKDIWSGQLKAPKDFNWLGLAQAAGTTASYNIHNFDDSDTACALPWAEVATLTYDLLVSKVESDKQEPYMLSSMLLRAAMIERFDAIPGHPVLDLDRISHWFFDNLTMSPQEAQTKTLSCWEDIKGSIKDMRELRRIKNRLNVLLVLVDSGKILPNEELKAWIYIRDILP